MNETIEILQKRIERALGILKSMDTLSVKPARKNVVEWYYDVDGSFVETKYLDKVARILEGDEDTPE